jgi:hypothetical protein
MTHLTAYTVATAIPRDPGSPLMIDRHGCKYLPAKMAAHRGAIRSGSVFRSGMANCLEMRRAGFHYSVIGHSGIAPPMSGYADCRSLNDEAPASRSEVTARDATHQAAKKVAATPLNRSWLRAGGRKINADECGFDYKMQVDVRIGDVRMMRIDENIPATPPPYATVAPILHKQMRTDPMNRGTNPNDGAAE